MYQQQQRQSPAKITDACFQCKKLGHWAQNCPDNPYNRSPKPRLINSDEQFPATYCRCGAGPCIILISNSHNNPNTKYYKCPGDKYMDCGYFKWCKDLKTEEIRKVQPKGYPICGCEAGVCNVLADHAGRKYFACRVKKEHGACNFKQWLDDSPDSISITSENPVADHTRFMDEELTVEEEMHIDAIEILSCEIPDLEGIVYMKGEEEKMLGDACGLSKETLEVHPSPVKDSIFENLNHCSDALKSTMHTSQVDNMHASVTAGSFPNFIPYPGKFPSLDAHQGYGLLSNPPSDGLREGSLMTGTILMEFEKLAQNLKNSLITALDFMSPHDHESMTKEAGRTFEALNRLQVDYSLFQLRVNEYIKQAASLAHVEKIIQDDTSYQELVDHRDYEQRRLEELSKSHQDANNAFKASTSLVCEKASCHDGSAEFDMELSSCKAENFGCLETFLKITKTMAECKENLQATSLKAEEALKKSEEREKGRKAAWAAFQMAKAELQN